MLVPAAEILYVDVTAALAGLALIFRPTGNHDAEAKENEEQNNSEQDYDRNLPATNCCRSSSSSSSAIISRLAQASARFPLQSTADRW